MNQHNTNSVQAQPSGVRLHAKRYGQVKQHSGSKQVDHLN